MQFRFEPSVWLGLARVVIYVAGVFGWFGVDQWTEGEQAAAILLVETVLGTIQRSFVTPNASLQAETVQSAKDGEKP